MSYDVLLRRAAERDIADALRWYEDQEPGLGSLLHGELDHTLRHLAEHPLIYPAVYRGIRRAIVSRFPLLVWFQVMDNQVLVLACTHGRMGPRQVAAHLR